MGNGRKDKDGECAQPLVAGSKDVESCENGETSDKGQAKKTCASNCVAFLRGAFGFLLFPFVFLLTLLAALVWIILLPAKFCSPCCIPLFDWVVVLLMLPVKFYRWVLGQDQAENK